MAVHRRSLLDHLHEKQKRIDCLDYLVWQMEKQKHSLQGSFNAQSIAFMRWIAA